MASVDVAETSPGAKLIICRSPPTAPILTVPTWVPANVPIVVVPMVALETFVPARSVELTPNTTPFAVVVVIKLPTTTVLAVLTVLLVPYTMALTAVTLLLLPLTV